MEVLEEGVLVEKTITNKTYCRPLGGNIKNDLSWEMNLTGCKKTLIPAVRKQLGALSSLRNVLSQKAKLQLVNGFILSKIYYIICLWGNTMTNQVRKGKICLNSAAWFVLNAKRTEKQSTLMRNWNWLTVEECTEFQSLTQLWKVVCWKVPEYMTDRIFLEGDSWQCKSTLRWNLLPMRLRSETEFKVFIKGLKRHIMERRDIQGPDTDSI